MSLKKYLPSYYLESVEVCSIQDAMDQELKVVKSDIEDLKKQVFVSTCTWAIVYWEQYVGIPSNDTLDLQTRRKAVIGKLSSQGTFTKETLSSICKNFTGSDVEIIDNLENYSVTIKFIEHGEMGNLEPLKNSIEQIKPAWLAYEFKFTFNSWDYISKYKWDDIKFKPWDDVRVLK